MKKRMRATLWPYPGEPRNLRIPHDNYFIDGANDLQKWNKCLQADNISVFPACSLYFDCGKSLAPAPVGVHQYVYTIANDEWCDKVYYDSASMDDVIAWARNRLQWLTPDGAGKPAIQQGIRFSSKATDSVAGRARGGIYCIHNQRLYITPWLQSNESLVVEWDGIKKVWGDTDLLDTEIWDADVEKAIREYVRWQDQDKHGCPTPQELIALERRYRDAAADCNWECENRTQQRPRRFGMQALRAPVSIEITDDAVPDAVEDVPMIFAVVGDFGVVGNADALAVSEMIRGWNPEFILALGDNSYTNSITMEAYDDDIGPFYHDFLFPYIGEYGEVASKQKMFAVIGNHDRDPNGKAQNFAAYFNVLGKPYYDFMKGPCHFILPDSGYNGQNINENPDGVTYDSVMGQWVQAKLASSKSVWKLAGFHHPAYCSTVGAPSNPAIIGDGTLSYGALRYPWKAWGADVALSGHAHNYEYSVVDDFPFIVNGSGGNSLASFVASPPAYSQFRYNTLHGAQKVTATRSKLIFEFFSKVGDLIHTVTLEK